MNAPAMTPEEIIAKLELAIKASSQRNSVMSDGRALVAADLERAASDALDALKRQAEEIAGLRRALEPFARHARYWENAVSSQAILTSLKALPSGVRDDTGSATLTVAHVRAACAALTEGRE